MNDTHEAVTEIKNGCDRVRAELAKVIVGQETLIERLYICLLCGGHALIEGVPGLGKTLVVKSLSKILDLKYSRIQFTPDLMPADILGTNLVKEDDTGRRRFEFYQGPIFGQLILDRPAPYGSLFSHRYCQETGHFGTGQHSLETVISCTFLYSPGSQNTRRAQGDTSNLRLLP